jgi:RNA polymerase sigma-70 factor (ECF subfamily)
MNDAAGPLYERVLVLRCQTGDPAAFAELVERYGPRLGYYLRKMLQGTGAAEDALQDVWFDAFRGLPGLHDPGALAAWLYRLARVRAARELRRRGPPCRPLEETDLSTAADEQDAFRAEDAERVHAGLDRLAAEHREVLVLRFLEGMDYADMARVIGCPLGTVRSRLHYAKRALRAVIEEEERRERSRPGQGPSEAGCGGTGRRP